MSDISHVFKVGDILVFWQDISDLKMHGFYSSYSLIPDILILKVYRSVPRQERTFILYDFMHVLHERPLLRDLTP